MSGFLYSAVSFFFAYFLNYVLDDFFIFIIILSYAIMACFITIISSIFLALICFLIKNETAITMLKKSNQNSLHCEFYTFYLYPCVLFDVWIFLGVK